MIPMTLQVRVVEGQVVVMMRKGLRVMSRPETQRRHKTGHRDRCQHDKGGDKTQAGHRPARQWIGHQPAGMAERELGDKKRRAIAAPLGDSAAGAALARAALDKWGQCPSLSALGGPAS